MSSFFDDSANASSSRDGSYIREGHFLARIDKVKEGKTNNKEDFFAIEMTVLANLGEVPSRRPDHIPPTAPIVPGESMSQMAMGRHKSSASNIKQALVCLAEVDEASMTKDEYHDVYMFATDQENATFTARTGEVKGQTFQRNQNALAGTVVEVLAVDILKKDSRSKDIEKITRKDDLFTKVTYKRVLKPTEYAPLLSDKIKALLFPGNSLENMIAAEIAAG